MPYSLDGCPMFADSGVRGLNKTGRSPIQSSY